VRREEHPAHRPTRYHWAAGLHPGHWVPALGGWLAGFMLLGTGAVMADVRSPLLDAGAFCILAALAWTGYWLIAVPNMKRFRRATDARLKQQYEDDYDYRMLEYQDRIHPDLQGKLQDMNTLRNKARELLQSKFGDSDPFAKDNLGKLDRLSISYIQMLVALTEYDQYVGLVDPESIERDLEAARLATEQSSASLRDVGLKQVELLEGRLERYRKAEHTMSLIRAQLKNVETTMKLLLDTAMTAADPKRVGRDIDIVLQNIRDSEILSAELASYDEMERATEYARLKDKL
jgi:hypothetical protein